MVLPWWLGSRCDQVQVMFVFSSSVHIQGLQSWITSDLPGPYPHCPPGQRSACFLLSLHGGRCCKLWQCFIQMQDPFFPVERLVMSLASHKSPLGQANPVDIVGWATKTWGFLMGREELRVSQIKMFCLWAGWVLLCIKQSEDTLPSSMRKVNSSLSWWLNKFRLCGLILPP